MVNCSRRVMKRSGQSHGTGSSCLRCTFWCKHKLTLTSINDLLRALRDRSRGVITTGDAVRALIVAATITVGANSVPSLRDEDVALVETHQRARADMRLPGSPLRATLEGEVPLRKAFFLSMWMSKEFKSQTMIADSREKSDANGNVGDGGCRKRVVQLMQPKNCTLQGETKVCPFFHCVVVWWFKRARYIAGNSLSHQCSSVALFAEPTPAPLDAQQQLTSGRFGSLTSSALSPFGSGLVPPAFCAFWLWCSCSRAAAVRLKACFMLHGRFARGAL